MALNIAKLGYPVEYITVADLNAYDLHSRMVRQLCGADGAEADINEGKITEWRDAVALVNSLPIYVYDATQERGGRAVESILAHMSEIKDERRVFVIDYAQRLRSDVVKSMDVYGLSVEVSDQLSKWAATTNLPIIMGSQVTVSENGSYTKGGYAWEEDAGMILQVRRLSEKEKEKYGDIDSFYVDGVLDLELQRFGPSYLSTELTWSESQVRWRERSTD
jgi:hypothetical protein